MNYSKFHSRDYILPEESENPSSPEITPSQDSPDNRTRIKKKNLINKLNYVHFNDGTILVKLKHKKYDNEITLEAKPQPCLKNLLRCHWVPIPGLLQKLRSYAIQYFLISDGLKLIRMEAKVLKIRLHEIIIELPDICYEQSSRKIRRHVCKKGINVELIQNGVVFYGELIDFSSQALKVEVYIKPPQTFQWIQPDSTVHVILKENDRIYFSGESSIVRHTHEQQKRSYVLEPSKNRITRYRGKEFRSLRHVLNPSPTIIFFHPFTNKVLTLPVLNISGCGISVEEDSENSILFSGLVLSNMEIEFANKCSIKCLAQVIYVEKVNDHDKENIKSGISILNMDIHDQMKIAGILHRSSNKNTYVCNRVDIDSLWKFFFDSGFIYPKKYIEFHDNKQKFIETYKKLYIENPAIARHIIYQDKGIIYGHVSMLRLFTNTWLFHHHASSLSTFNGPGVTVLRHLAQYTNDFYLQHSSHMNYVVLYYRTNNRFPNRIFGGFAKELDDVNGCIVFQMTYLSFTKNLNKKIELPSSISIDPAKFEDLLELKNSIGKEYGDLIFAAYDFEQELYNNDELCTEYERVGFERQKHVFSVKIYGKLKAIVLVLVSEIGINLTGLTNSIHVFIIDHQDFSKKPFLLVLYQLQKYYQENNVRVLIYPTSYAIENNIPSYKTYNIWVFNTLYTDKFISFVKKLAH